MNPRRRAFLSVEGLGERIQPSVVFTTDAPPIVEVPANTPASRRLADPSPQEVARRTEPPRPIFISAPRGVTAFIVGFFPTRDPLKKDIERRAPDVFIPPPVNTGLADVPDERMLLPAAPRIGDDIELFNGELYQAATVIPADAERMIYSLDEEVIIV